MLVDSEVVAACVPRIGLQLGKNVLGPGKKYGAELRKFPLQSA